MTSDTDALFARLSTLINDANEKQTATLKAEIQTEVSGVKAEIAELKKIVKQEEHKLNKLEKTQTDLQNKYNTLEKILKKNNILIFGLRYDNTEIPLAEYVIQKINQWLALDLTIDCLNDLYPIGKPDDNRPILVKFQSYFAKLRILRECRKLKGTGVSISEDLTKEDREKQKILIKHKKTAQSKGYKAYIRNNNLYINNEKYTIQQLQEKNNEEQSETPEKKENFEQRKVNSAPPTPNIQYIESEEESEEEIIANDQSESKVSKKLITPNQTVDTQTERDNKEDSITKKRKNATLNTEGSKKKKGPVSQIIVAEANKVKTRSVNK